MEDEQPISPITALCIVADKNKVPTGFEALTKCYDDQTEADLWHDSMWTFNRQVRYLCFTKHVPASAIKGVTPVVTNITIVKESDPIPHGFVALDYTVDSRERTLRKKYICIRTEPCDRAVDAVGEVIVMNKSKKIPKNYTLAGEVDAMNICFKVCAIPPTFGIVTSSSTSNLNDSIPTLYPGLSSTNSSSTPTISETTSVPSKVDAYTMKSSLLPKVKGIDGVPFKLNPRLIRSENQEDDLPNINDLIDMKLLQEGVPYSSRQGERGKGAGKKGIAHGELAPGNVVCCVPTAMPVFIAVRREPRFRILLLEKATSEIENMRRASVALGILPPEILEVDLLDMTNQEERKGESAVVIFGSKQKEEFFKQLCQAANKYEKHAHYQDVHYLSVEFNGKEEVIEFTDPGLAKTGGREMALRSADFVLLHYTAMNVTSLQALQSLTELLHSRANVPVLVICDTDEWVEEEENIASEGYESDADGLMKRHYSMEQVRKSLDDGAISADLSQKLLEELGSTCKLMEISGSDGEELRKILQHILTTLSSSNEWGRRRKPLIKNLLQLKSTEKKEKEAKDLKETKEDSPISSPKGSICDAHPCWNDGICHSNGSSIFSCECTSLYVGHHCQYRVMDLCASVVCLSLNRCSIRGLNVKCAPYRTRGDS
ncbi:unnamed protein product [Caenorhabditis auriculariae]|uniref:EGF-like domain-containing protein n=1 Tax=Caenorhabditis auriculariae TaxID=2777116 RepID=A0A8S1GYM8_9PELO|nr:unnamed protein product [Caenorhabditis auriculariae]